MAFMFSSQLVLNNVSVMNSFQCVCVSASYEGFVQGIKISLHDHPTVIRPNEIKLRARNGGL